MRGIDISNHQGTISAATAQCWAASEIGVGVVRLSLEDENKRAIARQQLAALQAAGITTQGYIWCYFSEDPEATAAQALGWYGGSGVTFWWLDAEEVDPRWDGDSPQQRHDWLMACLRVLDDMVGTRVGVYTANWWWAPYMAGTPDFASFPLWVAEYDGIPDLGAFYPFGGWTDCQGKQYTGSGSLCGMGPLDLDVFDEALVQGAGEDTGMRASQIAIVNDEILRNLDLALGSLDTALSTKLSAKARTALGSARDNLAAGARPAAETLARDDG